MEWRRGAGRAQISAPNLSRGRAAQALYANCKAVLPEHKFRTTAIANLVSNRAAFGPISV